MTTDLFAVCSGLDGARVQAAVPPSCRRPLGRAPAPARDAGDVVLAFDAWTPRTPAITLVPSFCALAPRAPSVRFELAVRAGGAWTPWAASATLGPGAFAPAPAAVSGLACEIDVFRAAAPAEAARLRVRLDGAAAGRLDWPWLATLSASDGAAASAGVGGTRVGRDTAVRLDVPARSQHEDGGPLGPRLCSPTSVAMALAYWGRPAPVLEVAADVHHAALDLYGVWPAAVRAAGRRGLAGYLLRFPDWASAAWCLDHGLPVVASVRYAAGELTGAAVAATAGHLIVLTGYEGTGVLVHDPAAASAASVPRRHDVDELARVWLARSGVGYVFFDAGVRESFEAVTPPR
jgi:hypothetical protein